MVISHSQKARHFGGNTKRGKGTKIMTITDTSSLPFAWLHIFRRLAVRFEYHTKKLLGMLKFGCAIALRKYR
jgi:hypothetical protein